MITGILIGLGIAALIAICAYWYFAWKFMNGGWY